MTTILSRDDASQIQLVTSDTFQSDPRVITHNNITTTDSIRTQRFNKHSSRFEK
jgi:hypothetical protein